MIKILKKTAALSLLATACLSTFASHADTAEDQALLQYLNDQPGMIATINATQRYPGYLAVDIEFQQPADHQQPNGEQFTQHLKLLHKDADTAMSLETHGYTGFFSPYLFTLADEKGLNQLAVEHRYFGPSTPANKDMSLLTIEQAADDMHRIVETIRPFYEGKWISTGSSKGGMTAMYHRYYYPQDVDATLANVAPMSFGRKDTRYVDFLENVGTETCREDIKEFQRTALIRKGEIDAFIESQQWTFMTFETVGYDVAFEKAVAEYSFTMFQQGGWGCDYIPSSDASAAQLTWEIMGGLLDFSDWGMDRYGSYIYQAYTQLGYPELPMDHLSDLLTTDPTDYRDYAGVTAENDHFDNIMHRIDAWTIAKADKVMLVYGELDPWSTGQFRPRVAKHADNYTFMKMGGNHYSSIFNLPPEDKAVAEAALNEWLDLPEVSQSLKHILRPVQTPKMASASAVDLSSDEAIIAKIKAVLANPEILDRRLGK